MIIHVDGSTTKTCAVYNHKFTKIFPLPFVVTGNQGEYWAVINALLYCKGWIDRDIKVYADSELIVRQLNDRYKIKNQKLITLHKMVKKLERSFDSVSYHWIPREENEAGIMLERKSKS